MEARGGGGVTYICRDTRMCHYFGYFFAVLPNFWVPLWAIPGFGGTFWAIPGFLGIIFFVKLDFFRNNPDFWVFTLIFY